MLVKIPDADESFVEQLKLQTGENTAAGAYRVAAQMHGYNVQRLNDAMDQLALLQTKYNVLVQVSQGARSYAALFLEKTAQGELL